MWYFSWILGLSFACTIGILMGIWYELHAGD
jgi:cyd operon protein YbgT